MMNLSFFGVVSQSVDQQGGVNGFRQTRKLRIVQNALAQIYGIDLNPSGEGVLIN